MLIESPGVLSTRAARQDGRCPLWTMRIQTRGRRRGQLGQTFVATVSDGSYAAQMHHQQFPMFVEPMLLATGRELPTTHLWWAELKLDGARGQLRVADGVASLRTRIGRRCNSEFPEIIAAAAGLPDLTLDGEIVVLGDDGSPDFSALRARLGTRGQRSTTATWSSSTTSEAIRMPAST
jgi:ATP-dependent DNA ligase